MLIRELKFTSNKKRWKLSLPKANSSTIKAFMKSVWHIGLKEKGRLHYWKLLGWTLLKHPRALTLSVTFAIYGFHFRRMAEYFTKIPF